MLLLITGFLAAHAAPLLGQYIPSPYYPSTGSGWAMVMMGLVGGSSIIGIVLQGWFATLKDRRDLAATEAAAKRAEEAKENERRHLERMKGADAETAERAKAADLAVVELHKVWELYQEQSEELCNVRQGAHDLANALGPLKGEYALLNQKFEDVKADLVTAIRQRDDFRKRLGDCLGRQKAKPQQVGQDPSQQPNSTAPSTKS